MKARLWLALPALIALSSPVASEPTGRDMPSDPCPALAAATLVYALVPHPLGARTWAERGIEAIRMGAHGDAREETDSRTSFILLALHTRSTDTYALEMMEAPREPEPAQAQADRSVQALAEPRLESAFEAMGLTPADVMGRPEIPHAALTIAGAILGLLDWGLERRAELRASGRGSDTLRIDRAERAARPEHVRFEKPPPNDRPPLPLVFLGKKIVRSIYKILLGVAIGVLIWGFVRNTA